MARIREVEKQVAEAAAKVKDAGIPPEKLQKRGQMTVVNAIAPLAELSGYATKLRSISQGRASFYMEPSHYDEVPKNITENLIAQKGPVTFHRAQ